MDTLKYVINEQTYSELFNIRSTLKPEMKEALKVALLRDRLDFGNSGLGVFGTIFGNTLQQSAKDFKTKVGLVRDPSNSGIAVIEKGWRDDPDFGLQCVAYMVGMQTLDAVKEAFPVYVPEPVPVPVPELSYESIAEWYKTKPKTEVIQSLRELGLISEQKPQSEKFMQMTEVISSTHYNLVNAFGKKFVKENFIELRVMYKKLKKINIL